MINYFKECWKASLLFWGEVNTSSNYYNDPYGGATNQVSHFALGAVVVWATCLVWAATWGEMPYKIPMWLILCGIYAVVVEYYIQKWNGADSAYDTMFFSSGAAVPFISLSEIGTIKNGVVHLSGSNVLAAKDGIILVLDYKASLPILIFTVIALATYVMPRAIQKYVKEREQ
jgi:hypothetical protein